MVLEPGVRFALFFALALLLSSVVTFALGSGIVPTWLWNLYPNLLFYSTPIVWAICLFIALMFGYFRKVYSWESIIVLISSVAMPFFAMFLTIIVAFSFERN